LVLTGSFEENGNNHTIHTEHTSHDDGNDRSEEEFGLEDGDGDDTDTGLGSAVGGSEVSENEGSSNTHGTEKDGLVGITKIYETNNLY